MTINPPVKSVTRIAGTIQGYKATRQAASFVFTDRDTTSLGVVAIAAGVAGLGGQAVSAASHATSVEEDADFVEFALDGISVKGWVWRSPFGEGDQVEVVGELQGQAMNAIAIARPSDRTVALYPHCSRGRTRHIKNAIKWWLYLTMFFVCVPLGFLLLAGSTQRLADAWSEGGDLVALGVAAFFGLMNFSLARRWMPFVTLAEKAFAAFGWDKPGDIDLARATKASRRTGDPGELGTFYFRY
ncbi:putative type VI secretion system effector [Piscinibacter terrae]|uniref:Uncharacterized protein n=1 Tax=Piscinibacter terrae TaxID=2496871 RepID=A0A3N7HSD0_9BURK|nr:putative type VI secretion system effector [Albitalea terrae]RQP23731.1 hypothetical protein DZC73_16535 [Albitalea terrae]